MKDDAQRKSFLVSIDELLNISDEPATSSRTDSFNNVDSKHDLEAALSELASTEIKDASKSEPTKEMSASDYLDCAKTEIAKTPGQRNIRLILDYLMRSSDLGNAEASNRLGSIFQIGLQEDKSIIDKQKAYRYYQMGANSGNANAQYNLANLYRSGIGVDKDLTLAAKWMASAANKGMAAAQSEYGAMLCNGSGVAKDVDQAAFWIEQAAKAGNADACLNLGKIHALNLIEHSNLELAEQYLIKAYELGKAEAASILGTLYRHKKEYEKACEWYKQLDCNDHPDAAAELAFLYYLGYGPNHSTDDGLLHATALVTTHSSSEKDANTTSLAKLQPTAAAVTACCFFYGTGLDKDYAKALEHALFATGSANHLAKANAHKVAAMIYRNGYAGEKDDTKAFEHYKAAAELGLPSAQGQLALIYRSGIGCEPSLTKARHWAEKAADAEDINGMYTLGHIILLDSYSTDEDIALLKTLAEKLIEKESADGYMLLSLMHKTGKGATKSIRKTLSASSQAYQILEQKYGAEKANEMISSRNICF